MQCNEFVEYAKTMKCKICGEPLMAHERDSGLVVFN